MKMHRSRHSIILNILDTCKRGSNKTRIVYQANLNFKTANPYIVFLIKNGFLETFQEKNIMYRTTNKGKVMLEKLKEVNFELFEEQESQTSDAFVIIENNSKDPAMIPYEQSCENSRIASRKAAVQLDASMGDANEAA
jgi:predicted transcriptional regulator